MKHKLLLIIALILVAKLSHSQIIDRYGFNTGLSYSTQIWNYKSISLKEDHEYKFGFQAFLQAEKDLGNLLAIRTELGFIHKGLKSGIEFISVDMTPLGTKYYYFTFNDIALNIGLKIKPLEAGFSPYLLAGLRGDYMFSYKTKFDKSFSEQFTIEYGAIIEQFNKFNLGGLIGLGLDIKDVIYFEIEYNPNFTKNLDKTGLSIKDNCWGAKIGLNINKLIK